MDKISYRIDQKLALVLGRAEGDLDFSDFELHVQRLLKEPDFCSGINGLYDFSRVNRVTGNALHMAKTSEQLTNTDKVQQRAKVAIVTAGNSGLESVFHGWKIMMAETLICYETFVNREQALKWLQEKS